MALRTDDRQSVANFEVVPAESWHLIRSLPMLDLVLAKHQHSLALPISLSLLAALRTKSSLAPQHQKELANFLATRRAYSSPLLALLFCLVAARAHLPFTCCLPILLDYRTTASFWRADLEALSRS
jgi:hypothetical protein